MREPMSGRRCRNSARSYSRSRRSGVRETLIADGLALEDVRGEERRERNVAPRRLHQSDAQRLAARIERCLLQKCSIHRAARSLQDSKPTYAWDMRVRADLHAAHPAAAPAAPLEVVEPAL